jgi:hypothetical protein
LKSTIVWLLLCVAASAQVLITPAFSSQRVDALAVAIARTEGFYAGRTKPARLHNPGDLKHNGQYIRYRNDADGFAALRAQLVRIVQGQSRAYSLDMSIRQMARHYATSALWPRNVARVLGISETTTLRAWLCNGDLDIPPVLGFGEKQ